MKVFKSYKNKGYEIGDFYDYKLIQIKKNMTNFFKVSWGQIGNAVAYVVLTAILGMGLYVLGIGDVFQINFQSLVNIGAISLIAGIVSIIKDLLTTKSGKLAGVIPLK